MASCRDFESDWRSCQEEAIRAGALEPQGITEGAAANFMQYQGQSFANTRLAQSRLQAWTQTCMRRKGYSV